MIKTLKIEEVRASAITILKNWEVNKNNIKLPIKSMYNLLKLKKTFETEVARVDDLIKIIMEKYGAVLQENGSFKVPEDKVAEVNKEMQELGETEVDIEYSPIQIADDSNIPSDIFEAILDFVDIEN